MARLVQQEAKGPRLRGMILALNHGITWPADLAVITRLVHVVRQCRQTGSLGPTEVAFYYVVYVRI